MLRKKTTRLKYTPLLRGISESHAAQTLKYLVLVVLTSNSIFSNETTVKQNNVAV